MDMKKVVVHGTFDIFHYGHLNYLEKAKKYGDYLIALVSSDKLAEERGKNLYFDEQIRKRIISSLKIVDEAIIRNTNITKELLKSLETDVFVTTDNDLANLLKDDIKVIVLPRTEGISSTLIRNHIKKGEK